MCSDLLHPFTDFYQNKIQRGGFDVNILPNGKQVIQKMGDFKTKSGTELRDMVLGGCVRQE